MITNTVPEVCKIISCRVAIEATYDNFFSLVYFTLILNRLLLQFSLLRACGLAAALLPSGGRWLHSGQLATLHRVLHPLLQQRLARPLCQQGANKPFWKRNNWVSRIPYQQCMIILCVRKWVKSRKNLNGLTRCTMIALEGLQLS